MRVWYDTEFLEDGRTIELISIGMVREDGAELYLVNADAPWDRITQHPWLMNNVIPTLDAAVDNTVYKEVITAEVRHFLKEAHDADPGNLELWGWYSSYDHVVLAQLFGRMIDLPSWCPMYTHDLKQEWDKHQGLVYPRQDEGLHNALADAKFLKTKHEWLDKYVREGQAVKLRGIQFGNGNTQNNSF